MSEPAVPFYSIELAGNREHLTFESSNQLSAWVERQQNSWKPILEIESAPILKAIRGYFENARTRLNNLFSSALDYTNNATSELKTKLDNAFNEVFVKGKLPPPSKAFPEFLSKIRSTHGDTVAAAALIRVCTQLID